MHVLGNCITSVYRWLSARDTLHRPLVWSVQAGIFVSSAVAAFLLRFDANIPANHLVHLYWTIAVMTPMRLLLFRLWKLDRGWWEFVSIHDVFRISAVTATASAAGAVLLQLGPGGFPRSIYLLDSIICLMATTGVRVLFRMLADYATQSRRNGPRKRIFLYGAGLAGVTLLRELRGNCRLPYEPVGFVDDNPRKAGAVIQGLAVLGGGAQLPQLAAKYGVEEVLVTMPSATGAEMAQVLQYCRRAGVRCRTIPAWAEVIEARGLVTQIRDVNVEDLLGRNPVRLHQEGIRARLEGRRVLITGAAGSIGSELCRQIGRFSPAAIIGLDVAETPLFHLDREMRERFPNLDFRPVIGSIQNGARLDEVLGEFRPSIIYHAAAYKHVPMMEAHVFEAVENNVFGTWSLACAARDAGVEDFVLISSDKAVRPTSFMGVSKRLAELLILSMRGGTKFVAVRFGNVLGSNGSVVPLFKSQIEAGGPITITHPEMRRYFMTIPEAAQLVVQASSMGQGGEIFVLDMGEPVRIVDLAINLILLSGLQPEKDIRIEYTGIRPGEKLSEELNLDTEQLLPTQHEKIRIFVAGPSAAEASAAVQPAGGRIAAGDRQVWDWLDELRECCRRRDLARLILTIKEVVPEYNPSASILRRLLQSEGDRFQRSVIHLSEGVGEAAGGAQAGVPVQSGVTASL